MRILHVLHTSLPYVCGYSIRTDYILRCQQAQGLTVAAVTSPQHNDVDNAHGGPNVINGIEYLRTKPVPRSRLPLLRQFKSMRGITSRVREAIVDFRPDVVHAHSPVLVGRPAAAAARRHDLPFVYEVRDLWENASVDRGKFSYGSAPYRLARALETRLFERSDAVIAICEKLREDIAGRVSSPENVFVIGNGVDDTAFTSRRDSESQRVRLGLQGKRIISYIGTFQPYEGLALLLSAMPYILAEVPNAHLVITGSGGVEAELRSQAERDGLTTNVTFTGRVPHDQVGDFYNMADVLVYPRILTRTTALTTPLKPLEGMAMAKPVIVSDVGAMHELVTDGQTGLMFRAGDALHLARQCVSVLSSDELQSKLGDRASQWVRDHRTWSRLVSGYKAIYKSAIERRI